MIWGRAGNCLRLSRNPWPVVGYDLRRVQAKDDDAQSRMIVENGELEIFKQLLRDRFRRAMESARNDALAVTGVAPLHLGSEILG